MRRWFFRIAGAPDMRRNRLMTHRGVGALTALAFVLISEK
jgi:hypothetical protein